MGDLYNIIEVALLLLGLASLITWTYIDSSARDDINTFAWTMSALFLPAVIFYVVIVRVKHPRTEPPTKLDHSAISLAISILGWTVLDTYYPAIFPMNTSGAVITVALILLLSVIIYTVLGVYRS